MEFSVYLSFNGDCEAAMNFYKDALGGDITMMQRFGDVPMPSAEEDKAKVMHCVLEKDGFLIMGSDGTSEHRVTFGNNAAISLDFKEEAEIDRIYAAISDGGQITMPLQDTFWGAKFGMCTDKFGTCWMFNFDRPKA